MGEQNDLLPSRVSPEDSSSPEPHMMTDKWLERGRNPATAAILSLIVIGLIYFFAQFVFIVAGIVLSGLTNKMLLSGGDVASLLTSSAESFAAPIRWGLLLSEFAGLLLPSYLLIRHWHTPHVRRYVRLRGAPAGDVLLAVLGTILIIPLGSFIANALQQYFHFNDTMSAVTEKLFTAHSPGEFAFLVLVVAAAPAICEEFFFRGYVQRTFERVIGVHSVALVGVIFGLFHMEALGLVTLTIIGIWLGYVYYRSRSLLPNMAAHFTNNFVALWMAYRAPVVFGIDVQNAPQIPAVWLLLTLPFFALVAWAYYQRTKTRAEEIA